MSNNRYITCRQLIDFIADYLERQLPPSDQVEFERHLAVCASCRAYLATYEATIRLGKAAFDDQAIDSAPEELIQAVLDIQKRRS